MKRRSILFPVFAALFSVIFMAPLACNGPDPVEDPGEQVDPGKDDPGKDDPGNPGEDGYIHAGPSYGDWFIKISCKTVNYHDPILIDPDGLQVKWGSRLADAYVETNMSEWDMLPDTTSWYSTEKYAVNGKNLIEVFFTPNDTSEERTADIVVYGIEGNVMCTDTLTLVQYARQVVEPIDGIDFELPSNTLFIDEKASSYFTESDPDKGMYYISDDAPSSLFNTSTTVVLNPNVSDACPNGLCGIYSMGTDLTGKKYMQVQPVALERAIKNLSMTDVPVDLSSHVVEIKDASGKPLNFYRTKASGSDKIDIHIPETTIRNWDQSLIVKTSVDMSMKMAMNLQIADGHLDYFAMMIDPDVTLSVDMDASISKAFVDEYHPFLTVLCGAFAVGPIVITPLIEFSFVVSAEGKVGLKAGVKYENNSSHIFVYNSGRGCQYTVNDKSPENQKNKTELSGSVYMEGSISCGLDESIGLGVYGTILYVTAGIQEKLKCTANISLDVDRMAQDPSWNYPSTMLFTTDVTLQGIAALKSLGTSLGDVKTLEKPYRLDSLFMFPRLKAILGEVTGRQAHIELEAANDLLMPMEVGIDVYAIAPDDPDYNRGIDAGWRIGENHWVDRYTLAEHHKIDPNKCRITEFGESANVYEIDIPLNTQSGLYVVVPFVGFGNIRLPAWGYYSAVSFYAQSGCEDAFREILLDISRSIDPGSRPDGWCSNVPISNWAGVDISYENATTPVMSVDLAGSNVKGVVTVGNHTEGLNCKWNVFDSNIEGKTRPELTGLDISDPHFDGWGNNVRYSLQTLRLNVNSSDTRLKEHLFTTDKPENCYSLPILKSLELYGSNPWVSSFRNLDDTSAEREMFPALERLSIKGTGNLKTLRIAQTQSLKDIYIEDKGTLSAIIFWGDSEFFGKLDVNKFYNLESVWILNTKPGGTYSFKDLRKLKSFDVCGEKQELVSFERCFAQDVALFIDKDRKESFNNRGQGYNSISGMKTMVLDDCGITYLHFGYQEPGTTHVFPEALYVTNCKSLGYFEGGSKDLHLVNLPALTKIDASDGGLESIEFKELPALMELDICRNHNLPRQLVPNLFDEVRLRRMNAGYISYYSILYDVAYIYYGPDDYTDLDWGFYYPDEPDCGYHWNQSRIGMPVEDKQFRWPEWGRGEW